MAEIDEVAAQVVRPLSATADRVVLDAFRLVVAPGEEYDESAVAIEKLEFAGSALGGLSATAKPPTGGATRASSRVDVPLADSSGGASSAGITVTLFGPGDVLGIDPAQIVRRYPAPGTLTAEETVLAHIEFDRPELPWAFSVPTAAAPLLPWVTLLVVERAKVRWESGTGLLPVLRVPPDELPPLPRAHTWAHAQAPQAENGASLEVRLSAEYAPVNLSRLLSPRVLRQDTAYLAAVVPTTQAGVNKGLGAPGGTLQPAWTSGAPDPVRLPVYDAWEFRTGPDGDFATLALRLHGVAAPYEVGRRFIDTSEPGEPLGSLPEGAPGAKQVLRCALFSPSKPPPEHEAVETAAWPDTLVADLRQQLDLPAQIEGAEERTGDIPNLPILGPRIYAALHRGSPVITGSDWFAEVNLGPTKRIVAGLGTRVVQRDQEQLMQAAWAQVGEVEKANRAIRLAQVAELVADRVHARLDALRQGRLVQLAAPLATRISVRENRSLAAEVAASATPPTALSGAFRRTTRPGGPMLRRAEPGSRQRAGDLVGGVAALRDFTRVYRNPDGIGGISAASIGALDAQAVAAAIDVPRQQVASVLTAAAGAIRGGLASYLTDASQWGPVEPGFDLGAVVVEDWGRRLLREPSLAAVKDVREQRVGPLLAELARSRPGRGIELHERLERGALELNNSILTRLGWTGEGPLDDGRVHGGFGEDGRVHGGFGEDGRVHGGFGEDGRVHGGFDDVGRILRGDVVRGRTVRGGGIPRGEETGLRAGSDGVRVRGGRESTLGTSLIRGGVSRIPVEGGLVATTRAGRLATSVTGVSVLDTSSLTRITPETAALTRDEALGAFADLAVVPVTPVLDRIDELPVDVLRNEMLTFVDPGGVLGIDRVPRRDALAVDGLLAVLEPSRTVRASLRGRLRLPAAILDRWNRADRMAPILAAPRFDRPMYQALNDYDRDWLVPGLGLLPADDFVTVLSTNSEFMEAFLLGLSDEMGRELLWRNYPTDQRGTYFRRFWDAHQDELTQQIHAFSKTPLASHISVGGSGGNGPRAVIVVKSELVRRYPDVIIQAAKNQGTEAEPEFERPGSPIQAATQLFSAFLEPDIALVGVDLPLEELDRPEWWILIAEHPTATRFDRPLDAEMSPGERFLTVPGASDGAAYAAERLHDPVRVAFQATDIIVREA